MRRHACPLCGRSVAVAHFKRHVRAHDRRGDGTRDERDRAWLLFVAHELERDPHSGPRGHTRAT